MYLITLDYISITFLHFENKRVHLSTVIVKTERPAGLGLWAATLNLLGEPIRSIQ